MDQDLGPLTFNQAVPPGPTFTETYALVDAAGQQAIDAGDDVGPPLVQNGRLRPVALPSDIGSTQGELLFFEAPVALWGRIEK